MREISNAGAHGRLKKKAIGLMIFRECLLTIRCECLLHTPQGSKSLSLYNDLVESLHRDAKQIKQNAGKL